MTAYTMANCEIIEFIAIMHYMIDTFISIWKMLLVNKGNKRFFVVSYF